MEERDKEKARELLRWLGLGPNPAAVAHVAAALAAEREGVYTEARGAGYARGLEDGHAVATYPHPGGEAETVLQAAFRAITLAHKEPELYDVWCNGYVHYTRPAGDPLLDQVRARKGYEVRPHVSPIERGDAAPKWRCTRKSCGWVGDEAHIHRGAIECPECMHWSATENVP